VKLLLVDDNELFLVGLRNLLEAADFEVVGVAQTAELAVARARTLQPDVVLMDVQMPGRSGIEATRIIKQQFPSIRVVMVSVCEDDASLFEAIKAGASGYLLKDATMNGFVEALQGLEVDHAPLSPSLTGRLMSAYTKVAQKQDSALASAQEVGKLTKRQTHILRLASEGQTNAQIAAALNLSERTVKYEFRAMADHLQLRNRAQVLAKAGLFLHSSAHA